MDAVCINMNGTEMAAAMGGHVVTYLSPFCGKYFIYDTIVMSCLNLAIDGFGGRVQIFKAPPRNAIQYGEFLRHHPFRIDFITDHKLVLSFIHGFM